MRTPPTSLWSHAAYAGFLLLFPAFVLYHYALAAGWIPPLLGGLFGAGAVAFSLFGIAHLASAFQQGTSTTPTLEKAFLLLVVYLFVWTLGAAVANSSRPYLVPALTESLGTLAIWLAVYFVGVRLPLPQRTWPSLQFAILLIALAFAHATFVHGSPLGPFLMFQGDTGDAEGATTYQGVGRSLLVIGVIVAAIHRGLFAQLLVLGTTTLALLALGSRAHLFAMAMLVALHVVLFGFRRRNLRVGLFAVIVAGAAGYAALGLLQETRAGEIFDLGASTSWQARIAAHEEAIRVIEGDPFFGRFGYHLGESSGYAHNILSAWSGYGGVAFLLFAGLLIYSFAASARRVLFRSVCPPVWVVAFQFSFTAVLLALAAEPIYASVFPALGWAFAVAALRQDRRDNRARHAYSRLLGAAAAVAQGPGPR